MFDLNAYVRNSDDRELEAMKVCKIRLIMTLDELVDVSSDTMKNVMSNFPFEYFTLSLKCPPEEETDKLMKNLPLLCRIEQS